MGFRGLGFTVGFKGIGCRLAVLRLESETANQDQARPLQPGIRHRDYGVEDL